MFIRINGLSCRTFWIFEFIWKLSDVSNFVLLFTCTRLALSLVFCFRSHDVHLDSASRPLLCLARLNGSHHVLGIRKPTDRSRNRNSLLIFQFYLFSFSICSFTFYVFSFSFFSSFSFMVFFLSFISLCLFHTENYSHRLKKFMIFQFSWTRKPRSRILKKNVYMDNFFIYW